MICPFYKNKEVFDGFNEIIEALGGKPMTEEEFRSAELRNQRTGRDFSAMEAAYTVYDRNGGNFLDMTPTGLPSILFLTLLDYFKGDRAKAIVAKTNVYSDEFFNWFGDWIGENKANPYSSEIFVTNVAPDYDSAGAEGPGAMFPIFKEDRYIGSIAINANYKGKNSFKTWGEGETNYVSMSSFGDAVEIEEEFRGKGYGKAAYFEFAKQMANMGYVLRSAPERSRSEASTRVWKSLERDGYAKKVGDRYEFINSSLNAVSKAVDANGEPLILWHGTDYVFNEFKYDENNERGSHKVHDVHSFFFTDSQEKAFKYRNNITMPVFLNMKNPGESSVKDGKYRTINEYTDRENELIRDDQYDSVLIERYDKEGDHNGMVPTKQWVVKKPNQIKSAINNNGDFSTENNDINHIVIPTTRTVINGQQFENASLSDFDFDIMSRLTVGELVLSGELIDSFIRNGSLSLGNTNLAQALKRHKIPVKLDASIGTLKLATTVTDKTTGESIILLNPSLINLVTKGYLGEAILHEVVHAVTVNAINNPSNSIERRFVNLNKKVFNEMSKVFPKFSALFNDIDLGLYALNNEKEFAAVFITDDVVRNAFYSIAKLLDVKKNGKFLNTFKNWINNIITLFVNKNIFNTTESLLKQYEKDFSDYLFNIQTKRNLKISSEKISQLYDSIDQKSILTESIIDRMNYLQRYADAVECNNIQTIKLHKKHGKVDQDKTYSFDDIVLKLQIRVNALKTSDLKQSDKNKYITDTKTQIDMFTNLLTAKYIAITSTLRQVIPLVLKDVRELKNISASLSDTISGSEYMYLMHSNISMYSDIANTMLGLLNQTASKEQIINEYNSNLPEDQRITSNDLEELKRSVLDLAAVAGEGVAVLKILRDRTAKNILLSKAEAENNAEDMEEYLTNITENPTFDDNISSFELSLGSMDSASNSALRALSGIVNRALKKADNMVIDKATVLLELLSKLRPNESVVDLYETDENGFTTGYLVRKLNYGRFYRDYDNELKRINKLISNVIGLKLEDTNRVAPDNDKVLTQQELLNLGLTSDGSEITVRLAWNELRNKWLNENCERKYNKKYYDAWNKVPQVAKDALDSINAEISSILSQSGVLGEDGYNHYEILSNEDWNALLDLWIQKKLLRSDYDKFGNLKQEGSTEYKIAKSLQLLSKDLYGDKQQKIKKDKAAWSRALDREIENCGGKLAYDKWKNKEEDHGFNVKRFKKWHIRNSRLEFKKDEFGNAIIFLDIDAAMQGLSVDYGPEYNNLKEKANDLLKPYRAQNGEVNASELPDAVKNTLNDIYELLYEIRQKVMSNNTALQEIANKYKDVFEQFIKFVDTEYYKLIKREIKKASTMEDGTVDMNVHDALLESYGHFIIDDFGVEVGFKPHRWLQRMEAVDIDKYMEYQPGDAWTEKIDDESLLNKNFDASLNSSFVPKKSKYDNSKNFAKVENAETPLGALYKEIVNTMHESNEMLTNRIYADDFLLPLTTGTIWKRMKRHSAFGKTKILFKYIAESFGVGYNPNDFSQIGSVMALDEYDSEGNTTISKVPISGQYPDGRTFNILPQYYTRKMEDPSQIDSDLVKIVTNYYKMSAYYNEKVAIKDDCETIVDFLELRKTKSTRTRFKKGNNKDKSRLFNAAEKFLEMNLYGIRRSNSTFNIGPIELLWSKTASLWKTWTTRRNLGLNPKVAMTGLLTTMGVHILNTISGLNYGHEGVIAFGEVIRRLFLSCFGVRYLGNPLSNDDMMVMAEHYNIANQAERKWEGTNRNRLIHVAYKHSIFGMLSTVDFWTKSIIMTSILMNHHYVNGKFVSREDIRNSRHLYNSKKEFDDAIKLWKAGPNLYSLLKSKNHRLTVDDKSNQSLIDEYNKNLPESKKIKLSDLKSAFELTDDVIKDRVQKTAEYADGMATDLQRAAITLSILGAFVLIHKLYLPLIIQRYFGKRVYDYDTHQYKNGIFRTLFDFVGLLMLNNLLAGIGAGIFTGSAFGGFVGGVIGGASALGVRAYGAYQHKKGKESKSVKLIFDDEFNNFSDKKSTAMSYANRYALKEVSATVIGYRLIVLPLVALVCSIADNDDDDKWWLLMLAYWLRSFEWEFYTAFRTDDMLNNVKSPTAATSVLDSVEGFVGSITNTISPQGNFLFDPSLTWDDWENIFGGKDNEIQSGAYEGWKPWERDAVKGLAFHNLYELLKNSKAKRKYQENQIMHINKSKND